MIGQGGTRIAMTSQNTVLLKLAWLSITAMGVPVAALGWKSG
jgi:hypothetical protein